jgi:hypothetical protein
MFSVIIIRVTFCMQQLPGQQPIEKNHDEAQHASQSIHAHAEQQRVPTAAEWRSQKKHGSTTTSVGSDSPSSPARFAIVALGVLIALVIAFFLFASLFRVLPGIGTAVANAITAFFEQAPEESIALEMESRTLQFAEPHTVTLRYMVNNNNTPQNIDTEPFRISYTCPSTDNLTLGMDILQDDGSWRTVLCDTEYATYDTTVTLRPSIAPKGMTTTTLSLYYRNITDSTTVFIANSTDTTNLHTPLDTETEPKDEDDSSTSATEMPADTDTDQPSTTSTATYSPPTRHITVSRYTGPADLALNIIETGIVINGTFYDVATIPSDRTAAVRFSVRNIGGLPSGEWSFVAELPTEGDATYRYQSPRQQSISEGTEGIFTLSFDDVLQKRSGTIEISLLPTNASDRTGNNTDVVTIDIDVE